MSFLDKVKGQASVNTAEVKKNPFEKPNPLLAKKAEGVEKKEEKKKLAFPVAKKTEEPDTSKKEASPLAPKKISIKEDPIEENKEPEPETSEVVAEKENVEEAVVVQASVEDNDSGENNEPVQSEVVEHQQETEDAQTPAEEVKEEVKPAAKSRSKRNKKPEPASENVDEVKEDIIDNAEISREPISYSDALTSVRASFVDDEWVQFRENVSDSLAAIIIEQDMNPSTLKSALSDLSNLRQTIWLPLQDMKTMYDQLSSKEPEGLIERIKKTAFGEAERNDMERKKAGIEACMSYQDLRNNRVVDLYELLDETRARYNFLNSTMQSIKYKSDILITMNGALKLEREHAPSDI